MAVTPMAGESRSWHSSESQKNRCDARSGEDELVEREYGLRRPGWRGKRMVRKRPQVEPTEDFQQILPLCWWPEQVEYERIRQPVLFGTSLWSNVPKKPASPNVLSSAGYRASRRRAWRVYSLRRRPESEGFHPT